MTLRGPASCVLAVMAVVLLFPGEARADIGIPMIFLTLPGMVAALVPVVLLEMRVLGKRLDLPPKMAFKVSAWANIFTTFLGIPLTWILLTLFEMLTGGGQAYGLETPLTKLLAVTWQAPWLIPYEADKNLYWMVPSAVVWLLIPSFFMSWWLEYRVARRMLKDTKRELLKSAMLRANLLSYCLLEVVAVGWLIHEVVFEL